MARPRNADGQRTRQAILEAALDLFGDRGFFGTSLRDVAIRVGIRDSAIYNYFPSKESLFEALIALDHDARRERVSAALDDPSDDPRVVLERFARLVLDDFASPRQQKLFRILMSDGLRLARAGRLNLVDRIGSGRTRIRDAMQAFIDRGWLRDGDPEVLAISFGGPLLVWRHLLAHDPDLPIASIVFEEGRCRPGAAISSFDDHGAIRRQAAPSCRGDAPVEVESVRAAVQSLARLPAAYLRLQCFDLGRWDIRRVGEDQMKVSG